jgi:hypothetical protein
METVSIRSIVYDGAVKGAESKTAAISFPIDQFSTELLATKAAVTVCRVVEARRTKGFS